MCKAVEDIPVIAAGEHALLCVNRPCKKRKNIKKTTLCFIVESAGCANISTLFPVIFTSQVESVELICMLCLSLSDGYKGSP